MYVDRCSVVAKCRDGFLHARTLRVRRSCRCRDGFLQAGHGRCVPTDFRNWIGDFTILRVGREPTQHSSTSLTPAHLTNHAPDSHTPPPRVLGQRPGPGRWHQQADIRGHRSSGTPRRCRQWLPSPYPSLDGPIPVPISEPLSPPSRPPPIYISLPLRTRDHRCLTHDAHRHALSTHTRHPHTPRPPLLSTGLLHLLLQVSADPLRRQRRNVQLKLANVWPERS